MSTVIHIAIGNSDDRLSQELWSGYARAVDIQVRRWTRTVHGHWHSLPDAPWQNAAWTFEVDEVNKPFLRKHLVQVAARYDQESIAWGEFETEFLTTGEAVSDIVAFLEVRLAEDKTKATPQTCIISGGTPAPVVPNCIGPEGRGCVVNWSLGDVGEVTDAHRALMREHSLTHASPAQRRALAQIEALSAIVKDHKIIVVWPEGTAGAKYYTGTKRVCASCDEKMPVPCRTLRHLAAPYREHPEWDPEWEVEDEAR